MRHIIKTIALSTSLLLAVPVSANAVGFETTFSAPVPSSVKVEVRLSEDLAYRANNLPEKLSDRGGSSGRSTAFSDNGHYGDRDLERLTARLEKKLNRQLTKRGVAVSDSAATTLRVTLTDVKNNRPTFRQLGRDVSLSHQSFGTGGAELEAEVLGSSGASLGTMAYDWYETDIREAQFGGIWSDANRAIDRFARRAAKSISNGPQS